MPSPGRVLRRIDDSRGGFARALRFGLGTRKNKDSSQSQYCCNYTVEKNILKIEYIKLSRQEYFILACILSLSSVCNENDLDDGHSKDNFLHIWRNKMENQPQRIRTPLRRILIRKAPL